MASVVKYIHCLRWIDALEGPAQLQPYPPPSAQTLSAAERRYHAIRPGKKNGLRIWKLSINGREFLQGWDAHIDQRLPDV